MYTYQVSSKDEYQHELYRIPKWLKYRHYSCFVWRLDTYIMLSEVIIHYMLLSPSTTVIYRKKENRYCRISDGKQMDHEVVAGRGRDKERPLAMFTND